MITNYLMGDLICDLPEGSTADLSCAEYSRDDFDTNTALMSSCSTVLNR
jgi:hypothetical protein